MHPYTCVCINKCMASWFLPKENDSSKKMKSIQISPSPESYKTQKKKKLKNVQIP